MPLPVPSRRGWGISLDFVELPKAHSEHYFRSIFAEDAANNFIVTRTVFQDVGLPNVIVLDCSTSFTSRFWTSLHVSLGSLLVLGSPHHYHTTVKVELLNDVVEDVLSSFVNERQDNWPELLPRH
jgi:hypothetical protein